MAKRKKETPVYGRVDDEGTLRAFRSGVELDPVDGRPVLADGMSRTRWLEQNATEADTTASVDTGDGTADK